MADMNEEQVRGIISDFLAEKGITFDGDDIEILVGNDLKIKVNNSVQTEVVGDITNEFEGNVETLVEGSISTIVEEMIQFVTRKSLIDLKSEKESVQIEAGDGISLEAENAITKKSNRGDIVSIANKNIAEVAELGSINRRSPVLITDKAGLGVVHNIIDEEDRVVLISEIVNYVQQEEVVKDLINYIRNTQGIDLTDNLIAILQVLGGK